VDESIKKVREKAEGFLYREIAKISKCLNDKKGDIFDLSKVAAKDKELIFEAHCYLANKYAELKYKYANEINTLWLIWSRQKKDKSKDYFYRVYGAPYIEPDISMIRAKEVLGIPGFNDDFNHLLEEFRGYLLRYPREFLQSEYRHDWEVLRSVSLRQSLKAHIESASLASLEAMRDHTPIKYKNRDSRIAEFSSWIDGILFLVMTESRQNYLDFASEALDKCRKFQNQNGSISDDIINTCSFITSLYLSNFDPQQVIQRKALDWLLSRQNKDGSWDHKVCEWDRETEGRVPRIQSWQVLGTVRVLEIIDLITNNEPLPPWSLMEEPSTYFKTKRAEEHEISYLEVPPGKSWHDVIIRFRGDDEIEIHAGDKSFGVKKYYELGFSKKNSKNKRKSWDTLHTLAKVKGELFIFDDVLNDEERTRLRKHISILGRELKALFRIEDEPFHPKKPKKPYRAKFMVSIYDDEDAKTEYEKLLDEDAEKKARQVPEKLRWSIYDEVTGKKKE